MTLLGYVEIDVEKMIWACEVAYEIIDGAPEVDKYLLEARNLLQGLLEENRV